MVAELLGRDREILTQVTAGLDEAGSLAGVTEPDTEEALRILGTLPARRPRGGPGAWGP